MAEGDGLNSAVEVTARAVGLKRRGEREGGKPWARASQTEKAGTTTTTSLGAIQGTKDKAVHPAQRQGGGPQGLNGRGTREDFRGLDHPGRGEKEELVELVKQKPLESHARVEGGARVWLQAPGKGCIRTKASNRKPRANGTEQSGKKTAQRTQGQLAHNPASSGTKHEGGADSRAPRAQATGLERGTGQEGKRQDETVK